MPTFLPALGYRQLNATIRRRGLEEHVLRGRDIPVLDEALLSRPGVSAWVVELLRALGEDECTAEALPNGVPGAGA